MSATVDLVRSNGAASPRIPYACEKESVAATGMSVETNLLVQLRDARVSSRGAGQFFVIARTALAST